MTFDQHQQNHHSLSDVASIALKFKHNKDGVHPHHDVHPPMEQITEKDKEESVQGKEPEMEPTTSKEKKEDLNNSREVNAPKSDEHSQAESDTVFEDEMPSLMGQFGSKRSVTKMNDENLDDIKSFLSRGELSLGITLLKRLRKYRLISSTVHHDGKIIVGISPRIEGRIKVIS